jgi:8-amino-7-oxononanoate synthase
VLRDEPDRPARALNAAATLAKGLCEAGLSVSDPTAAVVSVRAPSPELAVTWADDCHAAGIWVGCFRPPSVPDGISRLRLTARADLTDAELDRAIDVITRYAPPAARNTGGYR